MWKCGSQTSRASAVHRYVDGIGTYTLFTCTPLLVVQGPPQSEFRATKMMLLFVSAKSFPLCLFLCVCRHRTIGVSRTSYNANILFCSSSCLRSSLRSNLLVDRLNNGGIISLERRLVMRCRIASNCVFWPKRIRTIRNGLYRWHTSTSSTTILLMLCCYITHYITQSRQQTYIDIVFMCGLLRAIELVWIGSAQCGV